LRACNRRWQGLQPDATGAATLQSRHHSRAATTLASLRASSAASSTRCRSAESICLSEGAYLQQALVVQGQRSEKQKMVCTASSISVDACRPHVEDTHRSCRRLSGLGSCEDYVARGGSS
jgi:hypothetical protein